MNSFLRWPTPLPKMPRLTAALRMTHRFVVTEFHHIALFVGCVQAIRHGELHLSKLWMSLQNFPRPLDGFSFSFMILATFLVGCVWPWCFGKLHRLFAVGGLSVITFLLDTLLVVVATFMAVARPSEWAQWVILFGFGVRSLDDLLKIADREKEPKAVVKKESSPCLHNLEITSLRSGQSRPRDLVKLASGKDENWLGPYGE
jgi:hypothetical protein